jgi:hypothetical protein
MEMLMKMEQSGENGRANKEMLDYFGDSKPDFLLNACDDHVVFEVLDVFGDSIQLSVTAEDLVLYLRTQANKYEGSRSISNYTNQWEYIEAMAEIALDWFKHIDLGRFREMCKEVGLRPQF